MPSNEGTKQSWLKRVVSVILDGKKWLIGIAVFYFLSFNGGWLYKLFFNSSLTAVDYDRLIPSFSIGAAGDFISDSIFYSLFGTATMLTSFIHFGLLPLLAFAKSYFSLGTDFAIFHLAGKDLLKIFIEGYLPSIFFLLLANTLTTYLSLNIGYATYDAIKRRERTPQFHMAHRNILTMMPVMVGLWLITAAMNAWVSGPFFQSLI